MSLSRKALGSILLALALLVAAGVAIAARSSGGDRQLRIVDHTIEAARNETAASTNGQRQNGNSRRQADPTTPPPTPTPTPPPPRSLLADTQVVSYYGNPYSATMGILGEFDTNAELIARLRQQAAAYQALSPDRKVVPALELVYAVAQASPQGDGSYLLHMPDEMVEEYIQLTREQGMLFILDLQNGRANPVDEVKRIRHWLANEHVHVAVDPEFTFEPHELPNEDIGGIDGSTLNEIQDVLQQIALEAGIANKILIVHEFHPGMITNKQLITDRDRVDFVTDMDGWGPPPGKVSKYDLYVNSQLLEYAGIKLFYRWDKPLMTEAEVQALNPRPHIIIYQ